MTKICTLCNFSTSSEYSWESHLSRDEHRRKKLEYDNARMLETLNDIAMLASCAPNDDAELANQGFTKIMNIARSTIKAVDED